MKTLILPDSNQHLKGQMKRGDLRMNENLPGKSHAIVRRIRLNLEIPEASLVIKHALVGNVRRRSFSICLEYNCASSSHFFNISE